MQATGGIDLPSRIGNALVSGAIYLRQLAIPSGLAVFYPYQAPSAVAVLGALVLLGGLAAAAVALRARLPFLLAGLLWFGVMLVPVIGIVQVGLQAHADRYAYLPSIGVFLAIACLAERACRDRGVLRWPLGALAAALVALWTVGTYAQVRVWHDSVSLFEHALAVTHDNFQAHHNLGTALAEAGRTADAVQQFEETLRIRPDHFMAQGNLGLAFMSMGENEKALAKFNYVLSVTPRDYRAHNNMASALMNLGRLDEAIAHFRQALEIAPNHPALKANLAAALKLKAERDGIAAPR
jgi:Flp pilus assembly protein TadD